MPPINAATDKEVFKKVKKMDKLNFTDPIWMTISTDAKNFIKYLLTINQAERPTAQEALNHKWLDIAMAR